MGFPAKRVHMTGIGGVGMSGVARMLLREGLAVAGSDMTDSAVLRVLRGMGAEVSIGHSASNVDPEADMLVMSAAIRQDNPELVEARRRGMELVKYAAALGMLMAAKTGVAVSGTHGKTTTSAMLAWTLVCAGLDPSFVVGGEVVDLETSSRGGSGAMFVAEACEYDRSFLALRPRIAVITNIEEDHLDYYRDLAEIICAFREFVGLLPDDGLLVANACDPNVMSLAGEVPVRVETFAVGAAADWRGENLKTRNGT